MVNNDGLIHNSDELYDLSQRMGWSKQEMNKLAYDYFVTHICLGITDDGHAYYGGLGVHEANPFDDNNLTSIDNVDELNSLAKEYHWTQEYLDEVTNDCFTNHYCGIQNDGNVYYWDSEIAVLDSPLIG